MYITWCVTYHCFDLKYTYMCCVLYKNVVLSASLLLYRDLRVCIPCCVLLQNTPNDLQMLSDAPAHHIFCLLGPLSADSSQLPEVLCALQVTLCYKLS